MWGAPPGPSWRNRCIRGRFAARLGFSVRRPSLRRRSGRLTAFLADLGDTEEPGPQRRDVGRGAATLLSASFSRSAENASNDLPKSGSEQGNREDRRFERAHEPPGARSGLRGGNTTRTLERIRWPGDFSSSRRAGAGGRGRAGVSAGVRAAVGEDAQRLSRDSSLHSRRTFTRLPPARASFSQRGRSSQGTSSAARRRSKITRSSSVRPSLPR